jgi:tRNA pseudouridine38-40 synthase
MISEIKKMLHRYFIRLSYRGNNYHGWQIQQNAITVQSKLNAAISMLLKEEIDVAGSGRTDTGVHARYYVGHFDSVQEHLEAGKLIYNLNCILPKDIAIQAIVPVRNDAHSRFDAISRTYQYQIIQKKDPFLDEFACYFPFSLDLQKMNEASKVLFEYTDFTSFSKLHTTVKTNNCKIYHAEWIQKNDRIIFTIKADRFLRNMVRAIVGTLLEIGENRLSIEGIKKIIENKNRCKAGISVPAKGLALVGIEYPENHDFNLNQKINQ